MQPRIPRPSLYQKKSANTALIAVMWTFVAADQIGIGFMGFSILASDLLVAGYTVLGIILARSSNKADKTNGWIVICYSLFAFLIAVGRVISHHS